MLEFSPTTEMGETLSRAISLFVREARGHASALVTTEGLAQSAAASGAHMST